MAWRPMRSMFSSTSARMVRRLDRLRQHDIIEGIVGIVGKVGVGVALDHRQALGDAFVDTLARQFDAAPVDAAPLAEKAQQFAVAAADVEHARAGRHHVGDQQKIDARAAVADRASAIVRSRLRRISITLLPWTGSPIHGMRRTAPSPCFIATSDRKPLRAFPNLLETPRAAGPVEEAANDGEQFRLVEQEGVVALVGDDLRERDTRAPPALSAWTMARESEVGNSQSDVNETTQKRVGVPLKARATEPPKSAREVEIIHRARQVEIGIGVEAFDERTSPGGADRIRPRNRHRTRRWDCHGPETCGRTCGAARRPRGR